MSLQLERSKQLEYNLAVLKRRDAEITRVLDMAGHVVLYQFNEESKAWDRRNIEGSLFVVERASEPKFQFVVLNRLSSENLVETIDDNFQTELTEQFLLYRNLSSEILGVWFYSGGERSAIADLIEQLHNGPPPPPEPPADAAPPPSALPDPAAPAGGPAESSVANFFNMMAGTTKKDAPPPMPATAITAADISSSAVDVADTTAPAPPAATPPAAPPSAPPAAPDVSTPLAEPNRADASPAADTSKAVTGVADLSALKMKLSSQLRTLLDDDAFLSLLASEYVRQQQRAVQQARQARGGS